MQRYGKDWDALSKAIPGKSCSQVKNYCYNRAKLIKQQGASGLPSGTSGRGRKRGGKQPRSRSPPDPLSTPPKLRPGSERQVLLFSRAEAQVRTHAQAMLGTGAHSCSSNAHAKVASATPA